MKTQKDSIGIKLRKISILLMGTIAICAIFGTLFFGIMIYFSNKGFILGTIKGVVLMIFGIGIYCAVATPLINLLSSKIFKKERYSFPKAMRDFFICLILFGILAFIYPALMYWGNIIN